MNIADYKEYKIKGLVLISISVRYNKKTGKGDYTKICFKTIMVGDFSNLIKNRYRWNTISISNVLYLIKM